MKKLFILLLLSGSIYAQSAFEKHFEDKTMRFDYYDYGNKDNEEITIDEIIEEPIWGGSKVNLVDQFDYGYYMLKVFDEATDKLIYSRGYSTLFQEWQVTEEAKHIYRTYPGSVVFPYPKNKVRIEIHRRDKMNIFQKIFQYDINPANYFILKERRYECENIKFHYSGKPSEKLDILLIPEGYTSEEADSFYQDCQLFSKYLFEYEPFKENESNINIWGVAAYSKDSGVDIPGEGVWKKTLLNSSYYTFDSERYVMTIDFQKVRDVASNAPYDQIYILVNSDKYGGGAIYNFYSMTAVKNGSAKQVFIHELGHGLAGLGDEYGDDPTYQNLYPEGVEPWEVNLTTLSDFESKWENLMDEETPIPTPPTEEYKNKIGVFEGGGYVGEGVYRPTFDSIMRAFTSNEFNLVSKIALDKVIKFYSE